MTDQYEQRLLFKDGSTNIHHKTKNWKNPLNQEVIPGLHGSIVILIYMVTFIFCWIFFASIYYFQEQINGNICEKICDVSNLYRMSDSMAEMVTNTEVRSCWPCSSISHRHDPCVANVNDFAAALLFSVETQQSIGYGYRHPEGGCKFINLAVTLQSIIGIIINSILCALALFKVSKSRQRFARIQFSKNVMCSMVDDGVSRMIIRVNDIKGGKIRKIRMMALLVARVKTQEGEDIINQAAELNVGFETSSASLTWPVNIFHNVTTTSPLYLLREKDKEWELMVWVTGLCKMTGDRITSRTSYLDEDIVWGGQFVDQGGGGVRTGGRFGCRVLENCQKDKLDNHVIVGVVE